MRMPELCRLCGHERELQDSHVVPAFVFKWLKETSGTGFLRFGQQPNKRVQDGQKERWLCVDCEGRLNVWETQFATQFFHPVNEDGGIKVSYGEWLMKFCASASWRALLMMTENNWLDDFTEGQRKAADKALDRWKAFLLGQVPHPARFEQHMVVLDAIAETSIGDLPANFNRYILRTVELDAVRNDSTAFVLSKLGKIFILGFIEVAYPKQWVGTKICVAKGTIGGTDRTVPSQFGGYLMEQANRFALIHGRISNKQRAKMTETMGKDIERVATSGSMEAMTQDVKRSGKAAFDIHQPKDQEK